ncbi:response regulator transcription factor [Streptosporangiaceae bacterium NEAU-GS5]|nr:response regulator transcription factor [Streptosporangiaceae bacterium NEAU-GS5]
MIRVLIADDQDLVRAGLRMILEAAGGVDVVAEAANGRQAADLSRALVPDVALMDVRMPIMDGIQATRRVVESGIPTRVLMLTTFDLDDYVYQAMCVGASGFLLKTVPPAQLVHAVRTVCEGDALLAPSITRRLIERFAVSRPVSNDVLPAELDTLTAREMDVLEHVAAGLSNLEIGERLHVTEATVKTHVNRILAKLRLRDRVQAVVYSYEVGLVQPGRRRPPTA